MEGRGEKMSEVRTLISEYFREKYPRERAYSDFQSLTLNSFTSVHDYYKEASKLLNLSRPSLSTEDCNFFITQRIVESAPTVIRSHLKVHLNDSIESFLNIAEIYHSDKQNQSLCPVGKSETSGAEDEARLCQLGRDQVSGLEDEMASISTHNAETSKRMKLKLCGKCGSPNHRTIECRGFAICRKCNKKCHVDIVCELLAHHIKFNKFYLSSIHTSRRSGCLNLKILPLNTDVESLVDSGACASVISYEIAKKFIIKSNIQKFTTVSGDSINSLGSVEIPFILNGLKFSWTFFVLQSPAFPIILGRDFITSNKLLIDLNSESILLSRSRIENSIEKASDKLCNITDIFKKWDSLFASSKGENGFITLADHKINTGDHEPIRCRPYRLPMFKIPEVKQMIQELLDSNIIRPSSSPWCSPITLVGKKDGSTRLCVDFRKLNAITKKDNYPLPLMEELIDKLSGASYFTVLDLKNGYWQCPLSEGDREKTAFCPGPGMGTYEFNVLPLGLSNAPATFQRVMDNIIGDSSYASAYLDDIIIFSSDLESHFSHIDEIFAKLSQAGVKLKKEKCSVAKTEISYLGFIISRCGIRPDPSKTDPLLRWNVPKGIKDLQTFLGACNTYQKFIPHFAHICIPLYSLLSKNKKWEWTDSCKNSFEKLKSEIANVTELHYPKSTIPFILATDASDNAVGAVLSQIVDGVETPISFYSQKLNASQRRYSTIDKECYAIISAVRKFRHFLLGRKFTLNTDHNPLVYLKNMKEEEKTQLLMGYPVLYQHSH
ncbi:hypothetical protein RF11_03746 [Thelohanellus kitauei]|uniref:Reverse transcriptase domain-containing protein n=1 Tax=Thelohanellus kitauei TaxID=669202 RepID=A0A0C2N7B2_THEKT|nr:hypothetical protein RF11_03746 [Thelohanellus kitauei]